MKRAQWDFLECLGLEEQPDAAKHANTRGLSVLATASQEKEVRKIAGKIFAKQTIGKAIEEEILSFDLLSKPRILCYEGDVDKEGTEAVMKRTNRRHLLLFNDVLLVCSIKSSKLSEKFAIHNIVDLSDTFVVDSPHNPNIFEVIGPHRAFRFVADTQAEKVHWVRELCDCIFAIRVDTPIAHQPGWRHLICGGTVFSAALKGDVDTLRTIFTADSAMNVDVADEQEMSPLHYAALGGNTEAVEFLLEAGADANNLNSALNTPLHLAAATGNPSTVRLLIDHGADVNCRNLKDRDPLFMAVLYGERSNELLEVLELLKARGVDLNSSDSSGASPLHLCALLGLQRSAYILVDSGADVNVRHARTQDTPLHCACSVVPPDFETVRTLLEAGAFPNLPAADGRTPTDILLAIPYDADDLSPGASGLDMNDDREAAVMSCGSWLVDVLPAILDVVKCGGRVDLKSAAENRRDSINSALQMAQQVWSEKTGHENFFELVHDLVSRLHESKWVKDSASDCCLLCVDRWTVTNRRHHCRVCGILVCHACSGKTLDIGDSKSSRVCDGCFNRLCSVAIDRSRERERKAREEAEAAAKAEEQLKELQVDEKQEVVSPTTTPRGRKLLFNPFSSNARQANAEMAEALENMEERGHKLEQLSEKTADLADAASEYQRMTRELLRQQQQRAGLWGIR